MEPETSGIPPRFGNMCYRWIIVDGASCSSGIIARLYHPQAHAAINSEGMIRGFVACNINLIRFGK